MDHCSVKTYTHINLDNVNLIDIFMQKTYQNVFQRKIMMES